jgi:hypothetical protein
MDSFVRSLQAWQAFYSTVATAAATLTGLLFVALSLNLDILSTQHADRMRVARRAFGDFLYVLMIALTFLVPSPVPAGLAIALFVLGAARGIGLIRLAMEIPRRKSRRHDIAQLVREFALPLVASLGLLAVALAIVFGYTDAFFALVGVIAALLATASWNAWALLVHAAQSGGITSEAGESSGPKNR